MQKREIFDHKVTALNKQNIQVAAIDEKGIGGANHHYRISVFTSISEDGVIDCHSGLVKGCEIEFQNGALNEAGANGVTDQSLLAIVLDRLRGFQTGEFSCRENAIAITKIEEALMWTGKRAADRAARGVEGTHQK